MKYISFRFACLILASLYLSGCATDRITNDPVEGAYLGKTTTFEGTASYPGVDYELIIDRVSEILLRNGFKVTELDNKNRRVIGRRPVTSGFIAISVFLYPDSEGLVLRVVTQVPRVETGFYGLHEKILSQLN